MENNLYYTPTIEEFHVGFGYEYMNGDRWEESKMRIQDYKSDGPDYERSDSWFEEELLGGIRTVRVKYLDQSDIESLGWLDGELRGMTPFIFNEMDPDNEFQLYYQFDNQFAQIYNCHSQFVFQGTIKNKSELIKLMQQLNIK
jgi:hypothetical protein